MEEIETSPMNATVDGAAPSPLIPEETRKVSARSGSKYRTYSHEDLERAARAVLDKAISLRQASTRYRVPKTTLSLHMGDSRPRPLPRKPRGEGGRHITRYSWTKSDLEKALGAVQSDGLSTVEAARQYGVPASHLKSKKKGQEPRDLKGDVARLSLQQERSLADWASALCQLGCPPTKDEVFALAVRAKKVLQRGDEGKRKLGRQWVNHWMRRYPRVRILDWEANEGKEVQEQQSIVSEKVDSESDKVDGSVNRQGFSTSTFAVCR